MSLTAPRTAFPEFYDNPIIGAIADIPRWTVSDSEKMPINFRELMSTNRLWGAHEISEHCLVTLDELTGFLPNAANNAFYLRAQTDGVLVLDIEKTCPPEVAAKLLGIPSLYSELSMSGKGYHLLLPLPANFWDFPIATGKKVLKHEEGWFEILLDHWVTFTRAPVPSDRMPRQDYEPGAWEALYAQLAGKAVEVTSTEFDMTTERPEIPRFEQMVELISRRAIGKSLSDFAGDASRFEFSALGVLFNRLQTVLIAVRDAEPTANFDEAAQAWVLFEAAQRILPARDKHAEIRNEMPLLLNAAVSLVAQRVSTQEQSSAGR